MVAVGAHQYESRLPPQSQMIAAVALCMELGSDINASDQSGQTATHYAVQMGVDDVLTFLIERCQTGRGRPTRTHASRRRGQQPVAAAPEDSSAVARVSRDTADSPSLNVTRPRHTAAVCGPPR